MSYLFTDCVQRAWHNVSVNFQRHLQSISTKFWIGNGDVSIFNCSFHPLIFTVEHFLALFARFYCICRLRANR